MCSTRIKFTAAPLPISCQEFCKNTAKCLQRVWLHWLNIFIPVVVHQHCHLSSEGAGAKLSARSKYFYYQNICFSCSRQNCIYQKLYFYFAWLTQSLWNFGFFFWISLNLWSNWSELTGGGNQWQSSDLQGSFKSGESSVRGRIRFWQGFIRTAPLHTFADIFSSSTVFNI